MAADVRLRDGIEIDLADDRRVTIDGGKSNRVNVLSHAHGDHLFAGEGSIVCSELTAALASVRRDDRPIERATSPDWIELRNAGHIVGSRAVVVTDPATGRRYCYTGDISTRSRFYLDGFDPPAADVLIIESTYGSPEYRFPPTEAVVNDIIDWLESTADAISVLFGYPLGRAQKLQLIANRVDRGRLFVSEAIDSLNSVIERHREITFDASHYTVGTEVSPGDVLVLPTGMNRDTVRRRLTEQGPIKTAGVSGWAVDDSYRYRGDFDATFPLSDHCDFDELVDVVRSVDPERVYTHHGYADEFASILTGDYGFQTRALRRHQSTFADY